MEEYITRAEFEAFKKRIEQKTDEIPAINVNVASQDVISRLDGIQQYFSQELKTVSDTWLETLQEHYTEHKNAISDVQTVQKGHAKYFEEHGKRLTNMATKDDLIAMKNELLDAMKQLLLQKSGGEK